MLPAATAVEPLLAGLGVEVWETYTVGFMTSSAVV